MSKTHIIDGKTYVEVERQAEVGEKVIVFGHSSGLVEANGIKTVIETEADGFIHYGDGFGRRYGGYYVLEPVDQAPTSTEDLIANLVRRVASLESQLRDVQNNVERQGVEIAELEHTLRQPSPWAMSEDLAEIRERIASNEDDIRTLDARTQAPQSGAKLLAEAFEALAKYERSVGR